MLSEASVGQQRLTASIGLGEGFDSRNRPQAGDSTGAAWAFASRGCGRVLVWVWDGGWRVKVRLRDPEAKPVSTWFRCLRPRPSAMNLFCFTLVRFIFWTALNLRLACEESLKGTGEQRKVMVLLWETLLMLLSLTGLSAGWDNTANNFPPRFVPISLMQSFSSLLSFYFLHFVHFVG